MKKIALIIALPAALSLLALAQAQMNPPANSSAAAEPHIVLKASDLKWGDGPPALPAGAKMAVLEGDPTKPGPFTVRLQTPAGYKIPAHTHPTSEHVTVISGTAHIGMGPKLDEHSGTELTAGGYVVLPAGMQHFAHMTGETVVQISSMGPFVINYVNPADDPRKPNP